MSEYLKCDAHGCDHVETLDRITSDMVGKACPACGANLLTKDDWEYHDKFMRPAMEAMEALGLTQRAKMGEAGAVRVGYHNGELSMRLTPLPTQEG